MVMLTFLSIWVVMMGMLILCDVDVHPQVMHRHLFFSRFWSGDENNASGGRYHAPFIIGSRIMEACLIRFNSLSDFNVTIFTRCILLVLIVALTLV